MTTRMDMEDKEYAKLLTVGYNMRQMAPDAYRITAYHIYSRTHIADVTDSTLTGAIRKVYAAVRAKLHTTDGDWEPIPEKPADGELYHVITISCAFYTDGDYRVDSCDDILSVKDDSEDCTYHIVHRVEDKDKGIAFCKANSALWDIMTGCIRVGGSHHWLIQDFYKGIESLSSDLDGMLRSNEFAKKQAEWELTGNYEGTEITVTYSTRVVGQDTH